MLLDLITSAFPPVNITSIDGSDEIEYFFIQGIHDLFHSCGCALSTATYSKANALITAVEYVIRIADTSFVVYDREIMNLSPLL